jgi:hypothetical protein
MRLAVRQFDALVDGARAISTVYQAYDASGLVSDEMEDTQLGAAG